MILEQKAGRQKRDKQADMQDADKTGRHSAQNHTEIKEGRQQTQRSKEDMQLCGQRVVNGL
jgi:hypothetical protein